MSNLILKPTKHNPRGIPEAPFIEKVEDYVKSPQEFDQVFQAFQERLQQYKFMMESKENTVKDLKRRVPGLKDNLKICQMLKSKNQNDDDDDDDEDFIEVNYKLNETLYTKAVIKKENMDKVALFLGADIMMEYSIDEAIELLKEKIKDSKKNLEIAQEDCEFLRENITTMEVNTARLYNWDVERRQKERKESD
ncbi:related to Prefoldin subunit 3 [Saccharomycodes ludwigii]|uniref:Prefoldin subunit 3 n=1 Tax=Saccharomycodes ludwigii TaxID=36035 RepID=A0A376B4C4_9ASCO|nr:hypothetical protein SCDLUD_005068 [Saccharomycodes ludwigii]KAH3898740.1 hypothetical protein SCDLUD_005068 [Saccharomycodes ludwigii]SSD59501.1 related to Prefoldin subunit 3 [Saccharomycodes ludwigii]